MVVVCLMPPHSNHLIRLYSCPQNRFQISAKCFGNAFSVPKKITKNSSVNNCRNCPHLLIVSPAAQCVCIKTKQKWWPVVWPRLQWDVHCTLYFVRLSMWLYWCFYWLTKLLQKSSRVEPLHSLGLLFRGKLAFDGTMNSSHCNW